MAIGRMFTIAANFTDPDAYFVGGGVTDAGAEFRTWFVERVRAATRAARSSRPNVAAFAIVPDLDMAGARGSALAALRAIRPSARPRSGAERVVTNCHDPASVELWRSLREGAHRSNHATRGGSVACLEVVASRP